jgi:hypothetical protein
LRIFHEIDHPDGDPIRAKLHLSPPPAEPILEQVEMLTAVGQHDPLLFNP